MKPYLFLVILLYALKEGFGYALMYLNLKHLQKYGSYVPCEFEGEIDPEVLNRAKEYELEKTRLGFFSSLFGNIIIIVFFFGGVLELYNSWIVSLGFSFIASGLTFALLLSYAGIFLSIPFSLYGTFRIEKKHGFNTMTPRLWAADLLKSGALATVFTVILVAAALGIVQTSPGLWWLWIWLFFVIFSLFMMYVSPYVIEPLFNKFIPVSNPALEEEIRSTMAKADIAVSRVFQMDASKRSRHTNAYFSGIGRVKRIVLYDTLLQLMNESEILAILAHEAGHWKKHHIIKMIVLTEIISLAAIYVSFRVIKTGFLTDLLNLTHDTFYAKAAILFFLGSILSSFFAPAANWISRHFEKESDRFAVELTGNREAMARALVKLAKDNLSNLFPHPLYAAFYYSHPPAVERIRRIRNQ